MSQNPNEPNYNPYGQNLNPPSNPNYPAPGTVYGTPQQPSGQNMGYPPYPPTNPPSGPGMNAPDAGYQPYPPTNPPSGPNPNTPNSSYGPYNPYAPPPPPGPTTGPYDPYAQTAMGQQISNPGYPTYPPQPGMDQIPRYPSTPPQRKRGGPIIVAVIALIVIIGGVLGLIGYNRNQAAAHNSATATSIASGNLQATSTGQAVATSTSIAQAYPFSTNLVLNDPLVDNSKGAKWTDDKANGCFFSGSAYHVTDDQKQSYNPCFATGTNFTDFTFQAEVVLKQGDGQSDAGLILRADEQQNKFYRIAFDDDGGCSILVSVDTTGTNTRDLKDCSASDFNSGLSVTNTVGVVARGDQISFYTNGTLVTTVTDTTYSGGEIGFSVDNQDSAVAEAIYTNVKVWKL